MNKIIVALFVVVALMVSASVNAQTQPYQAGYSAGVDKRITTVQEKIVEVINVNVRQDGSIKEQQEGLDEAIKQLGQIKERLAKSKLREDLNAAIAASAKEGAAALLKLRTDLETRVGNLEEKAGEHETAITGLSTRVQKAETGLTQVAANSEVLENRVGKLENRKNQLGVVGGFTLHKDREVRYAALFGLDLALPLGDITTFHVVSKFGPGTDGLAMYFSPRLDARVYKGFAIGLGGLFSPVFQREGMMSAVVAPELSLIFRTYGCDNKEGSAFFRLSGFVGLAAEKESVGIGYGTGGGGIMEGGIYF